MQRSRVYRIGVVFIFLATLLIPFSYLALGRIETGKVTEIVFEYEGVLMLPSSSYPRVQFEYQNRAYSILGEENQTFLVGEEVQVIFYRWNPQKAKVYTFWGLFIDSIIQLPIGLLIWWALFKSYPNLFNTSNEPLWFENLLKKERKKK